MVDCWLSRYPLCETQKRENVAIRVVLIQTIDESFCMGCKGRGHCLKVSRLFSISCSKFCKGCCPVGISVRDSLVEDVVVPKKYSERLHYSE